ncbi:hypothetical protein BS78_K093000 [Paspalum vaginatum]|uniref:Uncharacterized protein n=1 Tax=Paspalum vaginatum TaxID=158149 RepID=A0A9W8CCN0_9POAL|nr:hypothetical protein BS78_K093000 [Paspalum vaginatum]
MRPPGPGARALASPAGVPCLPPPDVAAHRRLACPAPRRPARPTPRQPPPPGRRPPAPRAPQRRRLRSRAQAGTASCKLLCVIISSCKTYIQSFGA